MIVDKEIQRIKPKLKKYKMMILWRLFINDETWSTFPTQLPECNVVHAASGKHCTFNTRRWMGCLGKRFVGEISFRMMSIVYWCERPQIDIFLTQPVFIFSRAYRFLSGVFNLPRSQSFSSEPSCAFNRVILPLCHWLFRLAALLCIDALILILLGWHV